jgi:hypothetical protein
VELTDRDRRTLKIGGIIAAVLLVVTLAMNFLGGGEEEITPPSGEGRPTPTETPSGGPSETGGPTQTGTPVTRFTGRDPFSIPPYFISATATPSGSASPTSPGPTSPGPTPTSPGPTQSPTQPGNGSSTNIGGHEVVLIEVFTSGGQDRVQVEVDGTVYDVAEGQNFADGEFRLRSVSGNCATFVFGDEAFTLCITPSK